MTDQKDKPVLDVQTLEKLLEAAYVLQEHNREMQQRGQSLEQQSEQLRQEELATQAALQKASREPGEQRTSPADYTLTLAEIVEAQAQIQMRHLDLDAAMGLVAERTAKITNGTGAGIGILQDKKVRYRASCGTTALPVGTEIALENAVCAACFRTGQIVRSENFTPEFLFDPEPVRKRGIESLIAVPIYHDGRVAGALEVYYDHTNGFVEQDIHTCQLMAGLVTEAFARDAEVSWKHSLANERNTMLEALERLKPELAALAQNEIPQASDAMPERDRAVAVDGSTCRKCGAGLAADEQFCGNCGTPRADDQKTPGLQGKEALAWPMPVGSIVAPAVPPESPDNGSSPPAPIHSMFDLQGRHPELAADRLPDDFQLPPLDPAVLGLPLDEDGIVKVTPLEDEVAADMHPHNDVPEKTALVKAQSEDEAWTSAARAKEFFEAWTKTRAPGNFWRFWNTRRGDIYLAIAVILVAAVIRWGIWSDDSVGASGSGTTIGAPGRARTPDPEAGLSLFDKFLISVGLAEAPEPPEYKGNPDTRVWEDLHTALYYCPGSDLYGKTPKGKFTSQRDAQLDQFEPASRKVCD
ncbi:MAG TPA: GAF domain-containing protein [Candidatus Aquilonibacter sp.]|nr:GAF domain-containing protein [Candidatus Aquilonibacter sp.]